MKPSLWSNTIGMKFHWWKPFWEKASSLPGLTKDTSRSTLIPIYFWTPNCLLVRNQINLKRSKTPAGLIGLSLLFFRIRLAEKLDTTLKGLEERPMLLTAWSSHPVLLLTKSGGAALTQRTPGYSLISSTAEQIKTGLIAWYWQATRRLTHGVHTSKKKIQHYAHWIIFLTMRLYTWWKAPVIAARSFRLWQ